MHDREFKWQPFLSPTFDNVHRPIIPIEVKALSKDWKIFYPEIDSGAIISVFNKSDSEFLGLNLKNGIKFELKGVLGGSTDAYIHTLTLKIANITIQARIAFTDGKNHKQLLGRIDIFSKFQICLSGKTLKTELIKE